MDGEQWVPVELRAHLSLFERFDVQSGFDFMNFRERVANEGASVTMRLDYRILEKVRLSECAGV